MEQSPRLSLSYVQPAQAQKHVTVNETFRRLDALTQLTVLSRTTAVEPGAPAEGDAYILPASPAGSSWAGFSTGNIVAFQDGAWVEITALEGFRAWVSDGNQLVAFDGTSWAQVSGGGGGSETAAKFGINATADTTNRLSVKSDAVIFSHDDVTPGNDDCIVKVNKKAVGDTASHLFQTGFSGRAEFGIIGDDDFHIKVSPDGSSWTDAIFVNRGNGNVGIKTTSPGDNLELGVGNLLCQNGKGMYAKSTAGVANRLFHIGGDNNLYINANSLANKIKFQTSGTNRAEFQSDGSFVVGSPTGGGKGLGTINAKAVYDDGTLLTCYVFDQALDGVIQNKKWDDKVPDTIYLAEFDFIADSKTGKTSKIETTPSRKEERTHQPMRKFRARIGSEYDPLTLDGYAKHWREKRHLTSMPNEVTFDPLKGLAAGEWIQRLVETVEIQAVLIEELNQRLKSRPEGRMNSPRP